MTCHKVCGSLVNSLIRAVGSRTQKTLAGREREMHMAAGTRAESTYMSDATQFRTFMFCPGCNTILSKNATQCHVCGSAEIEQLRLMDIASRLRSVLLHRETYGS